MSLDLGYTAHSTRNFKTTAKLNYLRSWPICLELPLISGFRGGKVWRKYLRYLLGQHVFSTHP